MSELPAGWSWSTMAQIARSSGYGTSAKCDYGEAGMGVLRIPNIQHGSIDLTDMKRAPASAALDDDLRLEEGDLLLVRTNGSRDLIGRCAPVTRSLDCSFASYLIRFRLNIDVVDARFVARMLASPNWRRRLESAAASSAGQFNLSLRTLEPLPVALAPINEQGRIISAIEEAFSKLDAGEAGLRTVRQLLKRMREAVLAAGCRGDLTRNWRQSASPTPASQTLSEIKLVPSAKGRDATTDLIPGRGILAVGRPSYGESPAGWQWIQLTEVARLESGHTPSRRHPEYWNQEVPWMSIQDARDHHGARISETRQHISPAGLANSSARLLPTGTVSLSRTASVGYVVVMGRPMATSQDFVNWVCTDALVPEFLQLALMAEGDGIRRFGRGTTHTTIYYPELKALHICLPTVEEQQRIVAEVDRQFSFIKVCEHAVELGLTRSAALRRSVLSAAFEGRLVPQDSSDEPASALLERIRADHAMSDGSSGGRRRNKVDAS